MSKCISLRLKIGSQAVKKSQVQGAPLYCNVFLLLNPAVQGSSSALLSSGKSTVIGQTDLHVRPSPPQTASSLLYFFAKLLCKKPKNASNDKRGRLPRLVPIPHCNITSWFAIALAEMRTGRILRDKGDWKQSTTSRERPQHQNFLLVRRWNYTS